MRLRMHAIARVGGAQVRETCASQKGTCGIGMVDRGEDLPLAQRIRQVDFFRIAMGLEHRGQRRPRRNSSIRQGEHGAGATYPATDTSRSIGGDRNDALTTGIEELDQA